jgi:hypothetical protein
VAVRLRYLVLGVVAAAAFAVPAANAGLIGNLLGGNCPSSGTTVFAPWQDYSSYYLAPNGGFESGTTGWSLSGTSVVSGNEPFYASGTHSLSLPSGSTATSPVVCLGPSDLVVRMFAADPSGTDSGLRVRVIWYGLLNQVLGISDFATLAPGGKWLPSSKINSSGGLQVPLLPILGSTSARVQVTPLGAGSRWQIDDLYIDPWVNRIG